MLTSIRLKRNKVFDDLTGKVGFGEGFRMRAHRDLSKRTEGRRPKAPQEGTRGGCSGGLPFMGI